MTLSELQAVSEAIANQAEKRLSDARTAAAYGWLTRIALADGRLQAAAICGRRAFSWACAVNVRDGEVTL